MRLISEELQSLLSAVANAEAGDRNSLAEVRRLVRKSAGRLPSTDLFKVARIIDAAAYVARAKSWDAARQNQEGR